MCQSDGLPTTRERTNTSLAGVMAKSAARRRRLPTTISALIVYRQPPLAIHNSLGKRQPNNARVEAGKENDLADFDFFQKNVLTDLVGFKDDDEEEERKKDDDEDDDEDEKKR